MNDTPPDFELVPCPGCGGEKWAPAREVCDVTPGIGGLFRIVRCESCGLHFTNPRPMLSVMGRYYPDDYAPYHSGDDAPAGQKGSIRNLMLQSAFGDPSKRPGGAARLAERVVAVFRSPESFGFGVPWRGRGRLLDFGCGAGKFLRRMHALGWDVTGIDFAETVVSALRDDGLRALQGSLPHPQLTPRSFDVVTMRHALEHVPEPRAVLRAARELLDDNGMLLIQVPNYASWDVDYFGDAAMALDVPRHLTHFTPATLKAMLAAEGLRTTELRQAGRAGWIRKAARRARNGERPKFTPLFRSFAACRVAAFVSRRAGRGNEIIATAVPA